VFEPGKEYLACSVVVVILLSIEESLKVVHVRSSIWETLNFSKMIENGKAKIAFAF
jgi:hypothetical protein